MFELKDVGKPTRVLPHPIHKDRQQSLKSLRNKIDVLRKQKKQGLFGAKLYKFFSESISSDPNDLLAFPIYFIFLIFAIFMVIICFAFALPKNKFLHNFIHWVHYTNEDLPNQFYLFPPFYIQIVIFLVSLIGFSNFFFHATGKYLGPIIQNIFLFYCHGVSIFLLTYTFLNLFGALIKLILSKDPLAVIIPIIAICSFPSLLIGLVRSFLEMKKTNLPLANNNTGKALTFYMYICIILIIQCLSYFVSDRVENLFLDAIIILISIFLLFPCLNPPLFTSYSTFVLSAVQSICFLLSGVINLLSIYTNIQEVFLIIIYVVSIIITFIVATLLYFFDKKKWKKVKTFNPSYRNVNDLYFIMTFADLKEVMCTRDDLITFFQNDDVYNSPNLVLLILRFMYLKNDFASLILEISLRIISRTNLSMIISIQAGVLIDLACDQASITNEQASKKQKLVDTILLDCYQCHYEFWHSVINGHINNIWFCTYKLTKVIKNAENFFKQNNINEFSRESYRVKYIEFITNVTANLTTVDPKAFAQAHANKGNNLPFTKEAPITTNTNSNSNINSNANINPNIQTIKPLAMKNAFINFPGRNPIQNRVATLVPSSYNPQLLNLDSLSNPSSIPTTQSPNMTKDHPSSQNIIVSPNQLQSNFSSQGSKSSLTPQTSISPQPSIESQNSGSFQNFSIGVSEQQPSNLISITHIPTIDHKLGPELLPSVHHTYVPNTSSFLNTNTESFPQFDVVSNKVDSFSANRLKVCEAANKYRFKRQKFRYFSIIGLVIAALIISICLIIISLTSIQIPYNETHSIQVFYDILFKQFNVSVMFLNDFLQISITGGDRSELIDDNVNRINELVTAISALKNDGEDFLFLNPEFINMTYQNIIRFLERDISYFELAVRLVFSNSLLYNYIDERMSDLNKQDDYFHGVALDVSIALAWIFFAYILYTLSILLDRASIINKLRYQPSLIKKPEISFLYKKYQQMVPDAQPIIYNHKFSFISAINVEQLTFFVLMFCFHWAFIWLIYAINHDNCQQCISVYNLAISIPIIQNSLCFIGLNSHSSNSVFLALGNILNDYYHLSVLNAEPKSEFTFNNPYTPLIQIQYPSEISPIKSMKFYPLDQKNISIQLSDYLDRLALDLFEIQYSPTTPVIKSPLNSLIQFPLQSYTLYDTILQSFAYKNSLTLLYLVVTIFSYFIILMILFIATIFIEFTVNDAFILLTRILCLIPIKSPFFKLPIDIERELPSTNDGDIIRGLTCGIIFCDSQTKRITYMNPFAKKELGNHIGTPINRLSTRIIDSETGKMKFFQISPIPKSENPRDDFERLLIGNNTTCYLLRDTTMSKNAKMESSRLDSEIKKLLNFLFPASVGSFKNDSVKLITKFVVVEIVFRDDFKENEQFTSVVNEISKIANQSAALTIFTGKRWSVFAMFINFSQGYNSRLYVREAISFISKTMVLYGNAAKASLVTGNRCIFLFKKCNYEIFSSVFIKSAGLLRFIDFGEIICEDSIIKFSTPLTNLSKYIVRTGVYDALNEYVNYSVLALHIS